MKPDNSVIGKLLSMFGATWACESIFSSGHFINTAKVFLIKI